MSRFDFTLKYVLEVKMGKADELNRRLDWKVRMKNNNENQKLIRKEWVQGMREVVVERLEEVIKEKIKRARGKDREIVKVVEEIKKIRVRNLRGDE